MFHFILFFHLISPFILNLMDAQSVTSLFRFCDAICSLANSKPPDFETSAKFISNVSPSTLAAPINTSKFWVLKCFSMAWRVRQSPITLNVFSFSKSRHTLQPRQPFSLRILRENERSPWTDSSLTQFAFNCQAFTVVRAQFRDFLL